MKMYEMLVCSLERDHEHVHIAFGESFAASLAITFKRLGWEGSNRVICFWDHYAIGPLWKLHEQQGQANRMQWMCQHIYNQADPIEYEQLYQNVGQDISNIPSHATITIWNSMNAGEQVGLRYAAYVFRKHSNQLFTISVDKVCDTMFNQPDARIDYLHSGEIPNNKLELVLTEVEPQVALNHHTRNGLEQEWL